MRISGNKPKGPVTAALAGPLEAERFRLLIASLETESERLREEVLVNALGRRCESLREKIRRQAARSRELSLICGSLQSRSGELSYKSRKLRGSKRAPNE